MQFGLFPSWKIYFGLAALLTAVVGGSASAAAHRQVPVHPNLQENVAATATALSELMQAVNAKLTAEALQPTPVPPTATPIPGQADLAPFVVTLGQGVNIRSGPGTTFAVIGGTVANQGFPVVGQANGCSWLQVVLEDGSTGWISGSPAYTRLNVACTAVPAAQAVDSSATPTKTPGTPKVRPAFWPTLRPRGLATATAEPTATAIPPAARLTPATPATPPTATPTTQANATTAAISTPAATSAPSAQIGMITSFDVLGNWRRGDEPYGTLEKTTAQVYEGAAAAALTYDFPASAGGKSYVVFMPQPPLPIPGNPPALQAQVYGDGSGHFLNAWVGDAAGHVWQVSFGQIEHVGWQPLNAALALSDEWPNGPIEGGSVQQLTPPLTLKALVLDGVPDGAASQGVIYLDALAPGDDATPSSSQQTAAAAAPGATTATSPTVAPPATQLTGRIAYPILNGSSQRFDTYVYQVASGDRWPYLPGARQPVFSYGGHLLVNGDGPGAESLMRMEGDGSNQRPISLHPEDAHPHWSPSSASIVFDSALTGDGRYRIYYQADANIQQEPSVLFYAGRELFGRYPLFLDNWRIAYNGCDGWEGGSRCGIYTVDTAGSQPTRATDQAGDIPTDNLGSQILFTGNQDGNWDVYMVNGDGSGLQRLTDNPGRDGLATASPDNRSIAFVTDREGVWAAYVMNSDGSDQRKLFDLEGSYGSGDRDWLQERLSWGP